MKPILLLSLLTLLFLQVEAQERLNPADSTLEVDWFQEHQWGLSLTTSGFWWPSYLTGYDNMYQFLEEVNVNPERALDLMNLGLDLRWKKVFLGFDASFSVFIDDRPTFSRGSSTFLLYQDIYHVGASAGYTIFSNKNISVIPRIGMGLSNYSVQYSSFSDEEVFDFRAPRGILSEGSPRMFHESIHFDFAIELIYGLQGARRIYAIEGARLGYTRGLSSKSWQTSQGQLANVISDQSGQIYVTFTFGLTYLFQNKER